LASIQINYYSPYPLEPESEDIPIYENILSTMYGEELNTGRVWEAKRYIVSGSSENEKGYDLTLVEYAEDIYRTGKIQERQSSILSAAPMVFLDQQRNEMQLIIDALREQTSPQNIAHISRQESQQVTSTRSSRYRGGFYVIGLNDGTINNEIMNINNWGSYLGTTGQWENGYCYQWTINGWEKLIVNANNMSKYTIAITDLCAGAPNGYFSILFCKTIVAVDALIENLFANNIFLNGERGAIASDNYKEGQYGFLLPSNGRAVFNDEIYAYSLKVVSFEIIPPDSNGVLIENLSGYVSKTVSLSIGWYSVELSGGGGGRGGNGATGTTGGNGGLLTFRFYNHYSNASATLISGGSGQVGSNGVYVSGVGYGSGGGGDGSKGNNNVGGNSGTGNSFSPFNGTYGGDGGTYVNGTVVSNVGGGNNANGGAGFLRLYKLS